MTRFASHSRRPASVHVGFASMLLAAALALMGMRSGDAAEDSHVGDNASASVASASTTRFEAAALDGSGWAVRSVSIQVLSERVSDRKPTFDRGSDAVANHSYADHSPSQAPAASAAVDHSASLRPLFYLHGALLI